MQDGDLTLPVIHFNKDNYACYSCHEHQWRCGANSTHVNSQIRLKKYKRDH